MIGYEGAPRYPRAIYAITGDDEIVPPGIILEADRIEYSYVKQEGLWLYRSTNLGALAANFNQWLISPLAADFSRILILEAIQSTVAAYIWVSVAGAVGYTLDGISVARDQRAPRPNSRVFRNQTVGARSPSQGCFLLGANVIHSVAAGSLPALLCDGTIEVESTVVNVAQTITLWGRERFLNPGERRTT